MSVHRLDAQLEKYRIKVKQEDWLATALPSVIKQLELLRDGRYPVVLRGWAVVTVALRLLRCVWGSDADTLHAMQQHVIGNLEFSKTCEDHFSQFPDGCPDLACGLCVDVREDLKGG